MTSPDPSPVPPGEGSVLVATITRSHVHINTIAAANNLGWDWWIEQSGPYLANGRNGAVRNFLPTGHEKLLFLDSDTVGTPDQFALVAQMCTEETPVVGGRYSNPTGEPNELGIVAYSFCPPLPWYRRWWNRLRGVRDLSHGFHRLSSAQIDHDPDADMVEVGAVGTGFMCIHRTILEKLAMKYPEPTPWFTDMVLGEHYIGEDLAFCWRVRQLGYPVYLARNVQVGHYKELLI